MTTSELIQALSEFPPDTLVVVEGYEGGFDEAASVDRITIKPDHNSDWYYGRHGKINDSSKGTPAIFINGHRRKIFFTRPRVHT